MLKVEGNKRIERECKGMREQSMREADRDKHGHRHAEILQSKRDLTFSSSLSVQGLIYINICCLS